MKPLGTFPAVRLIAKREITTRVRTRSWRITTLVMVVLAAGGVILSQVLGGSGGPTTLDVAFLADEQNATVAAMGPAEAAAGISVNHVGVDTVQQGEDGVRSGAFDAFIASTTSGANGVTIEVTVDKTIDDGLNAVLATVAQQEAFAGQITALGGDPATVSKALAGSSVQVTSLSEPSKLDDAQYVLGFLSIILMYVALLMGSQFVAQGVVEEKTSRVVEILLATVRPAQLMAGKVLGIGVVTLIQLVLTVGIAGIVSDRMGVFDASSIQLGPTIGWLLLFFLIGFATFSLMLAAMASTVSRQEEVSAVIMPGMMLAIIPYIIGFAVILPNPDARAGEVFSMLPFFAPFLMPLRITLGVTQPWQVVVGLVVSLALLPVLASLAGKIYATAVLRTGARVKLRDALTSGG